MLAPQWGPSVLELQSSMDGVVAESQHATCENVTTQLYLYKGDSRVILASTFP